ncbi:MAG: hypothetical protein Q8O19_04290 [Rectinemataceae bacterium]|nr:hypothetical protein [Rectinemataceae bacterium]
MIVRPFILRSAPIVAGASKDYNDFVCLLENIDDILDKTGAEKRLIELALSAADPKNKRKQGWIDRFRCYARFEIRCNLLRRLQDMDYRAFSVQASDSQAIQWFINRGQVEGFIGELSGKGLSKSSLARYDKLVSAEDVGTVVREVCAKVSSPGWAGKMPGWDHPVSIRDIWVDCTCLETNIHFPVDWVLLRDAVRTLVRSIECMRRHGLRYRIKDPSLFLREINQQCMEMAAVTRKKDSKKKRKRVLREMKRLVECVERHAVRYRDLLVKTRTERTDFSEAEAAQVLARIANVLDQLPAAIKQAEDRIARGLKVEDAKKILSLYERTSHVIVRGKAGGDVEFGNTLYIAESIDGLIVDFKYYRDRAPADCDMVKESLERCTKAYGGIGSMTGDRGFDSPDVTTLLSEGEVTNYILKRSPRLMAEAFEDPAFRTAQRRRAQTEGRIGILKNVFIGDCLSGKGFDNQEIEVAWSILVHNFWVLGRMAQAKAQAIELPDKGKKTA